MRGLIVGVSRVVVQLGLLACAPVAQQPPAPVQVASEQAAEPRFRVDLSLAGDWTLWLDPGAVGVKDNWIDDLVAGKRPKSVPGEALTLPVPGPLEALPQTIEYDGSAWLVTTFVAPPETSGAFIRLRFDQVNYACRAWIDGVPVGEHEGSYAPFEFDLTGKLMPGEHQLVVMVIDPGAIETFGLTLKTTPHAKESWYHNYGGVLGNVTLDVLDESVVAMEGWLKDLAVPALSLSVSSLPNPLDGPYPEFPPEWELTPAGVHHLGQRTVLKGVLWQPWFTGTGGVEPTASELRREVRAIRDAGFDFVRCHVRPAPDAFLEACEQFGVWVIEEPAIGWVEDAPGLEARLLSEVQSMVERHEDHDSIVMWGVLNEASGDGYRYVDTLSARIAELDATRPILLDSGGFVGGGRYCPPGRRDAQLMHDEHWYPPYPLPFDEALRMRTQGNHPSHRKDRPLFVSEFGYGTILDTVAAVRGFRERGIENAESLLFEGMAGAARRALKSGESWSETGWIEEAQELHAEALEEQVATLRSNPYLDMLCLTQWRAVNRESSAGLLEPWGEARPALARVREALAPLQVFVALDRPSAMAGENVGITLSVVNDTGEPVSATAALFLDDVAGGHARAEWHVVGQQSFPVGVTALRAEIEAQAHRLRIAGVVAEATSGDPWAWSDGEIRAWGIPAWLRGVARPTTPASVGVGVVGGPVSALDPLRPFGVEHVTGRPAALLVPDPRSLNELQQAELMMEVQAGGVVVVLLPDPAADAWSRVLGAGRGRTTLAGLPTPVQVASAAGNFMGRYHLLRETPAGGELPRLVPEGHEPATVRPIGRPDALIAPVAMVVDPPEGSAASMITIGAVGERLGAGVIDVPVGKGILRCVGIPLLEPVAGAPDPLRAAFLADLLIVAAAETAARRAPLPPATLTAEESAAFKAAFTLVDRLVAVADHASVLWPEQGLPDEIRALLYAKEAALVELAGGRAADGLALLRDALAVAWDQETAAFVAGVERIVAHLRSLPAVSGQQAADRATWERVHPAVEHWLAALRCWFEGDRALGLEWLGHANVQLGLEPR